MKQECKIEYVGIRNVAKQRLVLRKLRIRCIDQGIKLLYANKRVFIGCVPVKKLMLHQASQIPKLGKVSSQKIDLMHHSKNVAHLPLARQNCLERFASCARVLKGAIHHPHPAPDKLLKI